MVGQPLMSPFGSATALVTPGQLSPGLQLQQQIDILTRSLNAKAPSETMYPSLGQVGEEVQKVSTLLDLYNLSTRDDETLNKIKSPTSKEEGAWWITLDAAVEPLQPKKNNPKVLRHSRSFDYMKPLPALPNIDLGAKTDDHLAQPAGTTTSSTQKAVRRQGSLEDAKHAILNADARRMAEFRKRFKNRPPQLQLSSILSPPPSLPSPPLPSALLKVKSPLPPAARPRRLPQPPVPTLSQPPVIVAAPVPRIAQVASMKAPYWVKKVPKTPRTMRTERRQGWSGAWDLAGIEQPERA